MSTKILALAVPFALLSFSSTRALADYEEIAPSNPYPAPSAAPERLRFSAGVRVSAQSDERYNEIVDSNVLAQFSLGASYTLITKNSWQLAAGLAWDLGGRSGTIRGQTSEVFSNRFTVPIDLRWKPSRRFLAFARVAPGATLTNVSIREPSISDDISDLRAAFATDVSVGVSAALVSSTSTRKLWTWLTPELGYGFAFASNLRLARDRDASAQLGSDQATNLGTLGMSGVFGRLSVNFTY